MPGNRGTPAGASSAPRDPLQAVHVGAQRPGDQDGAVRLLEVLEDGDDRAPHRQPGAVQSVRQAGLPRRGVAEADLRAPRLEVGEVAAGGDLPVPDLRRQPHFEIVRLGGGETQVRGAQRHDPVGQAKPFQDVLRVGGERLELRPRLLGAANFHQLHLVELVLADHPSHVLAVRARLRAEAGGVCRHFQREPLSRQDLVADDVGHRHLRGRDEEVVGPSHPEEIFLELGQLPRAEKGRGVGQEGRQHLQVPVLPRVDVQHEVDERPLEKRTGPQAQAETGPGDLRRPLEIEDLQVGADVDVIAHREGKRRGRPPRPDDSVVLFPRSLGNRRIGDVGDVQQDLLHLPLQLRKAGLHFLDPGRDLLHLLHEGGGVLLLPAQSADLLGGRVSLRPQSLHRRQKRPPLPVDPDKPFEVRRRPAPAQRLLDGRDVFTDELHVEHGGPSRFSGWNPASRIVATISSSDIRKATPAEATTFSSIIVLPKSFAPKNSPSWATFAPMVTHDTWTVRMFGISSRETARTRRYPTAWPNPANALSPKPGSPDRAVFPGWKVQGMKEAKPPVRSWRSRTRSRCLAIDSGASTLPNIIVAEVRSPCRCASRITAAHCSQPIFRGLIFARTSSSKISAPPPGMESSPAATSRTMTSRIVSPDRFAKCQTSGGEKPWSRIGYRFTARTRRSASSIPQSGCKPPWSRTCVPPSESVSSIFFESASPEST